jgi:gas vesicle protein
MKTFLAGLGAGYAIGTLVAPKAGSETRQELRARAEDLRNIAGEQLGKAKQAIGDHSTLQQSEAAG